MNDNEHFGRKSPDVKAVIKIILITACFLSFVSCFNKSNSEMVLFDFESDAELDQLHWKCYTFYTLSDENVTHGVKSLRLELYPSDFPGLVSKLNVNDWRRYKAFLFDIYNPEDEEVLINVRIDDKKDFPNYQNRYNKDFILAPGLNRLKIPLDSLITSVTHRALDLKNIYRLFIFMIHTQKKIVLYIDYVRLI